MSRCFPYTPHQGCENFGITREALVESIKKNEKAKKERKEKRRDKNHGSEESETKRSGHKKRHRSGEKSRDHKKGRKHRKRMKIEETEPIEKSSISEEHGNPVGSQYSFDSTLNSESMEKHDDDTGETLYVSPFMIKEKAVKNEPMNCLNQDLKLIKENYFPPLVGASKKNLDQKARTVPSSSIRVCSLEKTKFRDLMENWVVPPPPLPSQSYCTDDQEWLSSSNFGPKRFMSTSGSKSLTRRSSTCSGLWFLPEVEMYALPFTVPF